MSVSVLAIAITIILLARGSPKIQSGLGLYVKLWMDQASRGSSSRRSINRYESRGMLDLKFETRSGKRVVLGRGSFGVVGVKIPQHPFVLNIPLCNEL